MRETTKAWLESASLDLLLIERNIDEPHLGGLMAFHAQQAIEKSLKAVLEENHQLVPKIHPLQRLFELCRDYCEFLPDDELVEMLDKLYLDSRYPGDLGLFPEGKPTVEDVKKFYEFAKEIHAAVKNLMGLHKTPRIAQRQSIGG